MKIFKHRPALILLSFSSSELLRFLTFHPFSSFSFPFLLTWDTPHAASFLPPPLLSAQVPFYNKKTQKAPYFYTVENYIQFTVKFQLSMFDFKSKNKQYMKNLKLKQCKITMQVVVFTSFDLFLTSIKKILGQSTTFKWKWGFGYLMKKNKSVGSLTITFIW